MNTAAIEILTTIITLIGISIIGVFELSFLIVYGPVLKEIKVKEYLDKRQNEIILNPYDSDILGLRSSSDETFIAKHLPLSFLSKYYIDGIGRVWRCSKGHKRIDILFKTLKLKR